MPTRQEFSLLRAIAEPASVRDTKQSDNSDFLTVVIFSAIGLFGAFIAMICDMQAGGFSLNGHHARTVCTGQ